MTSWVLLDNLRGRVVRRHVSPQFRIAVHSHHGKWPRDSPRKDRTALWSVSSWRSPPRCLHSTSLVGRRTAFIDTKRLLARELSSRADEART
ncbi:unnamed protein product [Aphanomyces euteiches]